ncbi:MAG: translation initiation factor IF-2 [Patescibacteria group bacterium]
MNLSELARRLRMPIPELREKIIALGFDVGAKAIKVDNRTAQEIIRRISQERTQVRKQFVIQQAAKQREERSGSQPSEITIAQTITVRDLATLLGTHVADVMSVLMKNGVLATLNERIDFDSASIVAMDFGVKVLPKTEPKPDEINIAPAEIKIGTTIPRPPVAVVMGHVDHGKTTLLDTIRKTKVAEGEVGGITQHIGAYQAEHNGKKITFIDTPGHEAFLAMRSRGAQAADICVLVVAADDGVKPQTEESIKIIQKTNLPFVVAVNKMDKPGADIDRVKRELSNLGIMPEEWGGKNIFAPISAKSGEGISELLESLFLLADVERERRQIYGDPKDPARGIIIEAHLDKGEGVVATVLIQNGTLRQGDWVTIGSIVGKIRAMKNFATHLIKEAGPSTPVRISGLKEVPAVGDILESSQDVKEMKKQLKVRELEHLRLKSLIKQTADSKVKKLNLIIRADTLGSLEAIAESLLKIKHEEVSIAIVDKGLGNITESDVVSSAGIGAKLIGFNVKATPAAKEIAIMKNTELRTYAVIYELIDDIKKSLEDLIPPEIVQTTLGKARVLKIFKSDASAVIVGAQTIDGELKPDEKYFLKRKGEIIDSGLVAELRSGINAVDKIQSGSECGLKLKYHILPQIDDEIEVFHEEQKKRTLES